MNNPFMPVPQGGAPVGMPAPGASPMPPGMMPGGLPPQLLQMLMGQQMGAGGMPQAPGMPVPQNPAMAMMTGGPKLPSLGDLMFQGAPNGRPIS